MKIIFMGTSDFALPSLRALAGDKRYRPVAVVTQPDRKKGRGLKPVSPPVKAEAAGIDVYQPEDVNAAEPVSRLKEIAPDLLVVAAYGQILKPAVLSIPRLFAINVHGSLLPKYRGAAPVNRALMNGETETGVTIMRMNEFMDRGGVILQRSVRIGEEDDAETLGRRLAELGAGALLEAIDLIEKGKATLTIQDEEKATYAPRLKKEDGLIDWERSAREIHNLVRGTVPWPGAYTFHQGKRLKVWRTGILAGAGAGNPGTIREVSAGRAAIECGSGRLILSEIQPESGKRMGMDEYLRGLRSTEGRLGSP